MLWYHVSKNGIHESKKRIERNDLYWLRWIWHKNEKLLKMVTPSLYIG
jgi:hypothetical protein